MREGERERGREGERERGREGERERGTFSSINLSNPINASPKVPPYSA
jgi:hypothetical protein